MVKQSDLSSSYVEVLASSSPNNTAIPPFSSTGRSKSFFNSNDHSCNNYAVDKQWPGCVFGEHA
eukprot:6458796-Amphidinium_carterae.1